MTLIDGDRIVTAQLYDDQYGEFTEKKMSIIDYINAYTDEGVTEADVVKQIRWVHVGERLPEKVGTYMTTVDYGKHGIAVGQRYYHGKGVGWEDDCVIAWMPLPEPYKAESEVEDGHN